MAQGGKEEFNMVIDTLTENENTADLETNGDIAIIDMLNANKELEAARKANKRLMGEKIALIEALNSHKAKSQVN